MHARPMVNLQRRLREKLRRRHDEHTITWLRYWLLPYGIELPTAARYKRDSALPRAAAARLQEITENPGLSSPPLFISP